jgi:hypothetical protein
VSCRARTFLVLVGLLAGCASAEVSPEARLQIAEAQLKACKERFGLGAVPTPTGSALYDPAMGPTAQSLGQVRLKTLCSDELQELFDARRALKAQ